MAARHCASRFQGEAKTNRNSTPLLRGQTAICNTFYHAHSLLGRSYRIRRSRPGLAARVRCPGLPLRADALLERVQRGVDLRALLLALAAVLLRVLLPCAATRGPASRRDCPESFQANSELSKSPFLTLADTPVRISIATVASERADPGARSEPARSMSANAQSARSVA